MLDINNMKLLKNLFFFLFATFYNPIDNIITSKLNLEYVVKEIL